MAVRLLIWEFLIRLSVSCRAVSALVAVNQIQSVVTDFDFILIETHLRTLVGGQLLVELVSRRRRIREPSEEQTAGEAVD